MPQIITGIELDELICRIDASIDAAVDDKKPRQFIDTLVIEQLKAHTLKPSELSQLLQICRWCITAQATHISQPLLDEYADKLVLAHDVKNRDEALYEVAYIRVLHAQFSEQSLTTLFKTLQKSQLDTGYWQQCADLAIEHNHYDLHRQCLEVMYTNANNNEITHSVQYSLSFAQSYHAQGNTPRAHEHAEHALAALRALGSTLEIDTCIDFASQLCACNIQLCDEIIQVVRTHINEHTPPAIRHKITVHCARIHTIALEHQGATDEAIETGFAGHFDLANEAHTHAHRLFSLLLETQQHSRLARFMYNWMLSDESEVQEVINTCHTLIHNNIRITELILTLLICDRENETQALTPLKKPDESYEQARQRCVILARDWAHTDWQRGAVDVYEGIHSAEERSLECYQRALPLLESGCIACPDSASPRALMAVLIARLYVHGREAGLTQPFIPAGSAWWAYQLDLDQDEDEYDKNAKGALTIEDACPLGALPRAAAKTLERQYYEQGFARFEHCFTSGTGHYYDCHLHVFSMLCNNYANGLRNDKQEFARAITIHQSGFAVSPFAEHLEGICQCYEKLEDWDNYFIAADELWRFAQEHGYGRHDVPIDIENIAWNMHNENRDDDIAIWLPRLQTWWDTLESYEREHNHINYLDALMICLAVLAVNNEEDALLKIEPKLEEVFATKNTRTMFQAGLALYYAGRSFGAETMMMEALKYADPEKDKSIITALKNNRLVKARLKAEQPQRPWWKIW